MGDTWNHFLGQKKYFAIGEVDGGSEINENFTILESKMKNQTLTAKTILCYINNNNFLPLPLSLLWKNIRPYSFL